MYLAAFRTGNVFVLLCHLFQKDSKHLAAALALNLHLLVIHTVATSALDFPLRPHQDALFATGAIIIASTSALIPTITLRILNFLGTHAPLPLQVLPQQPR